MGGTGCNNDSYGKGLFIKISATSWPTLQPIWQTVSELLGHLKCLKVAVYRGFILVLSFSHINPENIVPTYPKQLSFVYV